MNCIVQFKFVCLVQTCNFHSYGDVLRRVRKEVVGEKQRLAQSELYPLFTGFTSVFLPFILKREENVGA